MLTAKVSFFVEAENTVAAKCVNANEASVAAKSLAVMGIDGF